MLRPRPRSWTWTWDLGRLKIGTANTSQVLSECTQSQSEFACTHQLRRLSPANRDHPAIAEHRGLGLTCMLQLSLSVKTFLFPPSPLPPCPPRTVLRVVCPNRLLRVPSLADVYRGLAAPCPSGPSSFIVSLGPVTVCKSDTMTAPGESDSLEIQSVPGNGFGASLHFCSCSCYCYCFYHRFSPVILRLSDSRTAADQIVSGSALSSGASWHV